MANGNVAGKKMSQYTPLANDEKEYFLGDGEGAVVTVGETSASSGKVNRLVKLSDIGGGGSGLPEIGGNDNGKVLTVDTDHAVWAEPSGGGGGDPLPDDVAWSIKSGSTPNYPEKTVPSIECCITGFEDNKAKLSWIWKLKPYDSSSFDGAIQSGAFTW